MKDLRELQLGESLKDIQLEPVSRLDLIKYAGASGDFNPIHTIDKEAEEAGLPGIIAHGMWTMGNLAKLFSDYLDNGFIQQYTVRFRSMVFLNDIITLKATLVEKEKGKWTFDVHAVNQSQKDVIKGQIVFTAYE